jgi:LuxR family transcriptional regulator, maltose regulon positive regulatory protein
MSSVGQNQPLSIDARQPLIARDGLVARLGRASARQVTVISAPAGSGKTSLLCAWAERGDPARRLAAVQVRRDQHDAQPFWLDLLNAVRQALGTTQDEPPAATPDFNGRAMVDRVLAELAGHGGRVILVIDDAHELASTEALAQLARLLANLPSQAHAIVSTRRDVWLGLHQLRLAEELAEIRAADLCFTERETRELLEASGVTLSAAGAALLHQRTEGWAAGLRLAALSLTGHLDPERFVAEFSGTDRTIAEYLLAEMLDRQPGQVQELLLRTSLLDRVNGELADLLTGRPGSEGILLELEDANAFVVSLDPGRTWFRFHQLFGDMLRLELRRTLPEQLPELYRRAAAWFAQHSHVVEAIRHTQAAGDWHDAARLLADHSFTLTLDGQARTVEVLLRAFPPGAAADPELALVRAGSDLVHGHLDEAAAHLAVAASYAETTPPDRQRRLAMAIASLRLWLARRRAHLAGVVEQTGFLAHPVTAQCGEEIAIANDLRAAALMNLGTVEAWSLALTDAERHLREGAALARDIGRPYLEVACLAQLGFASATGSLATAQERCREAIALAERHGWGAEPVIAPALITLAEKAIWIGEFGEGERWLRRAAQALEADDAPGIRLRLHLVTGMMHAGRGCPRVALEEFHAAGRLQPELAGSLALGSQLTGWTLATQARLGLTGEARAGLAALADDKAGAGEIRNARAVICLAGGDPAGALGAVREVLDGTAPVLGYVTVVEAQLLAGLAYRALGDRCAADQAAERALALAEADRLVLPFAMTGSRGLLETLPRHQTAHASLLLDLLSGSGGYGGAESPPVPGGHRGVAPRGPTEPLSPGEFRVLRYLPTNLSRPQIATELSVSVNTISTHIRSIYAKLGADDRSAAVHRARELRLLSAARALRFRLEQADLEQVQAECVDLGQHPVQRRAVQQPGEHGFRALPLRHHGGERGQHHGAEVSVDPDRVQGGSRVHAAMVGGGQVNPHHRDLVMRVHPDVVIVGVWRLVISPCLRPCPRSSACAGPGITTCGISTSTCRCGGRSASSGYPARARPRSPWARCTPRACTGSSRA